MTRHSLTEWERACMTSQLASDRRRIRALRRARLREWLFILFWALLVPAAIAVGLYLVVR